MSERRHGLRLPQRHPEFTEDHVIEAAQLARDKGESTWLTDHEGSKIAAIVPVDVLDQHDKIEKALRIPL
jgi:hypothetical protein